MGGKLITPAVYKVTLCPEPSLNVSLTGQQGPPGPPGVGTADILIVKAMAGENIGGGRVVISNNGILYYADNTNYAHKHAVLGITKGAISMGSNGDVQTLGIYKEPAWNWIAGEPIFVGTNGLLTQTPPSAGFLLIVAKAITPTDIFISIEQPIILGG